MNSNKRVFALLHYAKIYVTEDSLPVSSGVFVVLSASSFGKTVIAVGESENIQEHVKSHNQEEWNKNKGDGVLIFKVITLEDKKALRQIVACWIKEEFKPIC